MVLRYSLVAFLAIALFGDEAATQELVTVETSLGPVVGVSDGERGVDSFLGIQFAKVGERFSRSTLIQAGDDDGAGGGSGVINATSYGPYCYQSTPVGFDELFDASDSDQDEECLYLNIWRPSSPPSSGTEDTTLLPTMVYIHGGGFVLGSGAESLYVGSTMAAAHGVVVATINYRLGLFGSLVTGENGYGGMNFVHDQVSGRLYLTGREVGALPSPNCNCSTLAQTARCCRTN